VKNKEYYGVVYKITNLVNGKLYIGQSKDPNKRWSTHKSNSKNKNNKNYSMPITRALGKYGKENFSFEIIDTANSFEELNKLEGKYIKEYNSLIPNGYNVSEYNYGVLIINEKQKQNLSKININKKRKNSSSKYFGVSYCKSRKKWNAQVILRSKIKRLGSFDIEEDAAKARDIECLKPEYNGVFELNFPDLKDSYLNGDIKINKNKRAIKIHKNKTSKYVGVLFERRRNKWVASIYHNKKYYLGQFDNEEDAAKAYDKKSLELYGEDAITNF
jgi:group I intron endonuclease